MIRYLAVLLCAATLFAAKPDPKAEKEVLAAMESWRQAMAHRDKATLEKLYAPDITYSHSNGKNENKSEAIDAVVNGASRIELIDIKQPAVRIYGNTALVKTDLTFHSEANGKKTVTPLNGLFVWVKVGQGWQLVARQTTRLPQ